MSQSLLMLGFVSFESPSLESIPIVCDFSVVFSTNLHGISPKRFIELTTDLKLGT